MRTRSFPRCAEASDAGAKRNAGTTVGEFVTKILVGTLSWTDKSLIDSGRFYPASARTAEDRLRYYASQLPIVEIDSSYYGIPVEQNARPLGRADAARVRFQHKRRESVDIVASNS